MLTKLTDITRAVHIRSKLALGNDEGISAIEYALLAAGIAVLVLTAASDLGTAVDARFQDVATDLTPAP